MNRYTSKDLLNPDSEIVVDAHTKKCPLCKAAPGEVCRSTIDGEPLRLRLVHFVRTEMR